MTELTNVILDFLHLNIPEIQKSIIGDQNLSIEEIGERQCFTKFLFKHFTQIFEA